MRRTLVRGLLVVLPLLLTLWLLGLLFQVVDTSITPRVMEVMLWARVPGLERWIVRNGLVPLVGVLLTATLIYLLGLMAGNLMGRRILARIEAAILRIPLVKGIYGAARQLLNAFSVTGTRAFSRVVALEYPRVGLWTLGFVTSERRHRIPNGARGDADTVAVFLPTTPNPTSGWMLLVPRGDLIDLDLTIEEAVKLIVSGGIVSPDDLGQLARRPDLRPLPSRPES